MAADLFGDWAVVGGDVATAGLVGAAVWAGMKATGEVRSQLRTQRQLHRQQRVFELQSALNGRDFIEMSAVAADFLDLFKADDAAGRARWEEHAGNLEQMTVLGVLNFYELVATEYNACAIDRAAADLYLGYAAIRYWVYAQPFVNYLRSLDTAYFAEWKHFYDSNSKRLEEAAQRHLDTYALAAETTVSVAPAAPVAGEAPPVGEEIHLPGPSILPLLCAVAITLVLVGLTTTLVVSVAGGALLAWTSVRWIADVRSDMDDLPWGRRTR